MYENLKKILKDDGIIQQDLACVLGISSVALNHKLNGKSDFTMTEGKIISDLIGKPLEVIFFKEEVAKMSTVHS